jgi:hypothetical protein
MRHPDQFSRFREVVGRPMEPDVASARLGARIGWTGLLRLLPAEAQPGWPESVSRAGAAFLPTSLALLALETAAVPITVRAARAVPSLGDRPLVVLSAAREYTALDLRALGVTPELGRGLKAASRALQEQQAASWSSCGRHQHVKDASHYIQFDKPDAVADAVRRVVLSARSRAAGSTPRGRCPA